MLICHMFRTVMSELPEDLAQAMSWDFSKIQDLIIDLNLERDAAITELCSYLREKYLKESRSIEVGREIAYPLSKKMLFFNNEPGHIYVRLRNGIRRGFIEDNDGVPICLRVKDDGVNRITVRIRPHPAKFTPLRPCQGHSTKFRTTVGYNSFLMMGQYIFYFRNSGISLTMATMMLLKTVRNMRRHVGSRQLFSRENSKWIILLTSS